MKCLNKCIVGVVLVALLGVANLAFAADDSGSWVHHYQNWPYISAGAGGNDSKFYNDGRYNGARDVDGKCYYNLNITT